MILQAERMFACGGEHACGVPVDSSMRSGRRQVDVSIALPERSRQVSSRV